MLEKSKDRETQASWSAPKMKRRPLDFFIRNIRMNRDRDVQRHQERNSNIVEKKQSETASEDPAHFASQSSDRFGELRMTYRVVWRPKDQVLQ